MGGFLSALDRRAVALALASLAGACTVVSGVGDLSFDLDPSGAGGSGGSTVSTTTVGGAGGTGGGGSDGAGGMAPPMMPVGDDFAVGTDGPAGGVDLQPGVSVTGDGTFVVSWTDFGSPPPDGNFSGIRYDTFSADTCSACFELANIATTSGSQISAPGAGVPGGTASLYGWTSQGNGSSGAQVIFIGSDGNPAGSELHIPDADWITVGAAWAGFGSAPSEVTLAWLEADSSSQGVYTARLAPGAAAVPAGTLVNVAEMGPQTRPAVGVDASGQALIAWVDNNQRIRARRVDPSGTPLGDDIAIDDDSVAICAPAVAASAERFVVVYGKGTCDGNEFPVGGQIFAVVVDGDGNADAPRTVSSNEEATTPDVAFDGQHFVVVWSQALAGDGARALQRRRLWQDGRPADDFPNVVHAATANLAECLPSVVSDANGRVAIAWSACDAGCDADRAFPPTGANTCKVRMRYFE